MDQDLRQFGEEGKENMGLETPPRQKRIDVRDKRHPIHRRRTQELVHDTKGRLPTTSEVLTNFQTSVNEEVGKPISKTDVLEAGKSADAVLVGLPESVKQKLIEFAILNKFIPDDGDSKSSRDIACKPNLGCEVHGIGTMAQSSTPIQDKDMDMVELQLASASISDTTISSDNVVLESSIVTNESIEPPISNDSTDTETSSNNIVETPVSSKKASEGPITRSSAAALAGLTNSGRGNIGDTPISSRRLSDGPMTRSLASALASLPNPLEEFIVDLPTSDGTPDENKSSEGNSTVTSSSSSQDTEEVYDYDEDCSVKYCICEGPSEGQMVLCGNDICPLEWFHFSCVQIKTAPKGKWYCIRCRDDEVKGFSTPKPRAKLMEQLATYNLKMETLGTILT